MTDKKESWKSRTAAESEHLKRLQLMKEKEELLARLRKINAELQRMEK